MELGGKIRHVEVIPHTDVNDVSLKYFWNYEGDITLLKLKGSKRKNTLNILHDYHFSLFTGSIFS